MCVCVCLVSVWWGVGVGNAGLGVCVYVCVCVITPTLVQWFLDGQCYCDSIAGVAVAEQLSVIVCTAVRGTVGVELLGTRALFFSLKREAHGERECGALGTTTCSLAPCGVFGYLWCLGRRA